MQQSKIAITAYAENNVKWSLGNDFHGTSLGGGYIGYVQRTLNI